MTAATERAPKACGECEGVGSWVECPRGCYGFCRHIEVERTCGDCDGSGLARCELCGDKPGTEWEGHDWACSTCARVVRYETAEVAA